MYHCPARLVPSGRQLGARLLGLISSGSVGRGMSLGEGDDEGEREGSGTEDRDKYCFGHFTVRTLLISQV